MCILILKPKGITFPPIEHIKNSAANNPDGFALAWNEGGRVRVFKTLSESAFIEAYRDITSGLRASDTAMIIHARIATHGTIKIENCHAWHSFPGTDYELAFAHNGILSTPPRDGMTDSETFLRDYFEPAFKRGGWLSASAIITRKIGASKFGFIDREGNIRKFGSFFYEKGCYYSNGSYKYSARPVYYTPFRHMA